MKFFKKFTAVAVALTLLLTVFSGNIYAAETQSGKSAEYLQEVIDLIKQKYNGNIDEDQLIKSAVDGMFDMLDQYSTFYDLKEFDAVYGSLEGAVEGVGIQVQQDEDYISVIKVYTGSPAQKAGILSGDKIAEVNGESVKGMLLEDVVAKVKGTAGTKVKIGVLRQGQQAVLSFSMKRAQVNIPSVSYEVRGDIGYILIDSFVANTYSEVSEALEYFDNKNMTKVVLDLRNSPGGLVDQAVNVAKYFVPKGLITTLDYKDDSEQDVKYYSELKKIKYKLAVLVNENTASASEILTGAIKDTKAGIVLGSKTYGKAKVQTFTPILSPEGYERLNKNSTDKTVNALEVDSYESDLLGWAKMTIGLYYTPNGESIDLKGIEPDIYVEDKNLELPVNLLEKLSITVKPKLGTQYLDVFNAECILKLLGYDVDTPDLTFDNKTFNALKKFQKDSNLYSYGTLDFSTQKVLNNKLSELKQTNDAVYAKAVKELQN